MQTRAAVRVREPVTITEHGDERDPRVDPEPGDWLEHDGIEVRVDRVSNGWVFFARFRAADGSDAEAIALVRISLYDYRVQADGARVLRRAEEAAA